MNRYFNKPSLLKKMRDVRDLINKPNMFRDLDNEVDVYTFLCFLVFLVTKTFFAYICLGLSKDLLKALFTAKCI